MRCFTVRVQEQFAVLKESEAALNAYLPYNMTEMCRENQRRPSVLICPGGGYVMCSQREAESVALQYLKEGYNVFVLWYSVAPQRFPQPLREAAAAVELIHRNAEVWNCDESRVAILGFSAGGHLAALYSNAYDWPEVREVLPESKPVQASVLCYPVISADPAVAHMGSFEALLGHKPLIPEEVERFSCDRLVRDTTPPAFLWHTSEDDCVPVQNSLRYAAALAEHHVPFELHIFPYGYHGMSTCTRETLDGEITPGMRHAQRWVEESCRWLKLQWNIE